MSTASSHPNGSEQSYRRLLPGFVFSWVCLLFVAAVTGVEQPGGWHTGLLAWGLGIGAAAVLSDQLFFTVGLRLVFNSPSKVAAVQARHAFRRRINTVTSVVLGLTLGTVSAATGWVWLIVAVTVSLVLPWIIFIVAFPRLAERIRAHESDTDRDQGVDG